MCDEGEGEGEIECICCVFGARTLDWLMVSAMNDYEEKALRGLSIPLEEREREE